ncbi:hypothetical protein ACQ4PT_060485 [Festuca glaucescens]
MEVEAARCECCGFNGGVHAGVHRRGAGRSTSAAGSAASARRRWATRSAARAPAEERAITTAEALDRHGRFAREAPRTPGKAAEELVAAVSRLLRRCLVSPPASPAAPRGQKVAAGPRCPDADDA